MGCCECGGGEGGKPTTMVNGNKIKSCDDPDLKTALGGFDGQNYCHNAPYPEADKAHNLYKKYDKVVDRNKDLEEVKNMEKVVQLEDINKSLKGNTEAEEEALAKFNKISRNCNKNRKSRFNCGPESSGNAAQLKEGKLLTPSEKFKIFGWSILGISLLLVIIGSLNKEID